MGNKEYTIEEMKDFLYGMIDTTDIEDEHIIHAIIEKIMNKN